ncbi:hypothetical protein MNEG_8534 [Monoraphidium neglectum]|uniref:Uncharacterized protein n=1 Tax=Monoraphidium neglectum TaxID=145388 RepID=A0A0D2M7T1_9CHLO|nr:hypothetical protein MNEG_8534 [Monoraphidium neglectum]KIY99424.1 hypothetical protein MNEG_8534 [Monoraphidium neglectum]|eukprot:XP_013898444.1 hypothetical protein MNEG_8534 [Monoraphidium neglectum]
MAAHLSTDLYLLCVVLIGSIALAQGQQSEVVQDQAQLDQYGQVAPPSVETIGASQNYRDFVRGYLQYVAEAQLAPPLAV